MFIIETFDSIINMDNVEKIEHIDYGSYSEIKAITNNKSYSIYKNTDISVTGQVFDYISRAIREGFTSILIQLRTDFVQVYDSELGKYFTWELEV